MSTTPPAATQPAVAFTSVPYVGLLSADTTPMALTVGRFIVKDDQGHPVNLEVAIGAATTADLVQFGTQVFNLQWDPAAFMPCRVVPEAGFLPFAAEPARRDRDESHPNPVARHLEGQLDAMKREVRLLNAQRTRVADRPPELEKLEARILAMTDVITTLAGLVVRESMQSRAHAPLARARDLPATGVQ